MRRLGAGRRAIGVALAATIVASVATGCGGGDDDGDIMDRAERALDELRSGVLTLVFRAEIAEQENAVGFSVSGPFDLRDGSAALSFTSTRWVGEATREARLAIADGVASITVGGTSVPLAVPPGGAGSPGGQSTPAADLRLSRWVDDLVEEPAEVAGDPATRITGTLNVGAMADDLARLAATVEGATEPEPLDDDSVERLADVVRESSISVLVDEQGVPRLLQASVDFGADVPPELAPVLGVYAGLQLRFELSVDLPNQDVVVPPPVA